MTAACDVIGNRDIEHMTPHILRSITNPADVPEIMHIMAGVTFAQSVESPALAMVVPLLLRGLRARAPTTQRQTALVIDNMSKLVDDPHDAAPLVPLLKPALANAADTIADPEARQVVERASAQMDVLAEQVAAVRLGELSYDAVLAALREQLPAAVAGANPLLLAHVAHLMCSCTALRQFQSDDWSDVVEQLRNVVPEEAAVAAVAALIPVCRDMVKVTVLAEEDDDDAEELCNCQFTLAYGTKILLHNTTMRLKRGHKYGLLGQNDSGKTTLMRAIAGGSIEGFPDPAQVRTVFVEADILGELSHLSCVDYVMEDPRLAGLPRDEVLAVLATVGFREDGKAKPNHAVSTLSGGWRMKLAMARAMLQRADILLLDEPTNHLDVINVAWVKNYINSLTDVTCIMVSHDTSFLNDCCTDILQINRLKLRQTRGNLDVFLEKHPEARAYFTLKDNRSDKKFTFPQPGRIEGVRNRSTALMKMKNCSFTYPGNDAPTLHDITITVSMASRVGCVGENGAGKSTMIKVLTGEVVPQTGDVWKHPNARVAYVAQHAFHHIEEHLNKTANEYIRWRYETGEDKESLVKVSMVLTPEEEALQLQPFVEKYKDDAGKWVTVKRVVARMTGTRRQNKKAKCYEYEVRYRNGGEGFLPAKTLEKQGWSKNVKAIDTKIAQRAGMYVRTLTSANVEQHLGDCGLEAEFASHYRMSALSGGQKVKVVLAACMWNNPHILILDEPTNYLDRESLGALAKGIEEYQGGVVIISHNNEFVSTLCSQEWVMDAGHLTTKGVSGWMDRQDDKIAETEAITEMTDAMGNTMKVKQAKKALSKRELKVKLKKIAKRIQKGEELDSDDESFAIEHELYA